MAFPPRSTVPLLDQDREDIYDEVVEARRFHRELTSQHLVLLSAVQSGLDIPKDAILKLLAGNTAYLRGVGRFLNRCRDSFPPPLRYTTASGAVATQVFGVPELLIHIAKNPPAQDILSFFQINKAAQSIFEDSPELHDALHMRSSASDGYLRSHFDSEGDADKDDAEKDDDEGDDSGAFPGLTVGYVHRQDSSSGGPVQDSDNEGDHEDSSLPTHRVQLMAHFEDDEPLPRIGATCRKMLVCLPSVQVMQITINCCKGPKSHGPRYWAYGVAHRPTSEMTYRLADVWRYVDGDAESKNNPRKTLEIINRSGITVGDLYEATRQLRAAHLVCPHAAVTIMDRDTGEVEPSVRFHADVVLKGDDPFVMAQADREMAEILKGEDSDPYYDRTDYLLGMYSQAKKKGEFVRYNVLLVATC